MSYHNFKADEAYDLDYIVAELTRFLNDGRYDDVRQKTEHLETITDSGVQRAVFSPFAEKGWGASPINPRVWKTLGGEALCQEP